MGMLANRLSKNFKHLQKWAKREQVSCYRVYQSDIPEYPVTVDWYDGQVAAWANVRKKDETELQREDFLREVYQEIALGLGLPENSDSIFLKDRHPGGQYARITSRRTEFVVQENGLKFLVNLSNYHDTGLFLDHRVTRQLILQEAMRKKVLNLFCYTGSFSVYAAAGQAKQTVSVDLSNRYLQWTLQNLRLNAFEAPDRHYLIRANVLEWLPQAYERGYRFDLIVCDPPTFSNSKRMTNQLDIERDHSELINMALNVLEPGGKLYFSTNKKGFKLDISLRPHFSVHEITQRTLPEDFKGRSPHKCFVFSKERVKLE